MTGSRTGRFIGKPDQPVQERGHAPMVLRGVQKGSVLPSADYL